MKRFLCRLLGHRFVVDVYLDEVDHFNHFCSRCQTVFTHGYVENWLAHHSGSQIVRFH